jgi:hypothetical protein
MVGRRRGDAVLDRRQQLHRLLVHLQPIVEPAEEEARQEIVVGRGDQSAQRLDRLERLLALDEVVLDPGQEDRAGSQVAPPLAPLRRPSAPARLAEQDAAGRKRRSRSSTRRKTAAASSILLFRSATPR